MTTRRPPVLALTEGDASILRSATLSGNGVTLTSNLLGQVVLQGNVVQLCSWLLQVGGEDLAVAELLAERVIPASGAGFWVFEDTAWPPTVTEREQTST